MKDKDELIEAIFTIKQECKAHTVCGACLLFNDESQCILHELYETLPSEINMSKVKRVVYENYREICTNENKVS